MKDKYESKAIIISLCLLAVFISALIYASVVRKAELPDCLPYNARFSKAGVDSLGDNTYQVFYRASMWRFEPQQVYLPAGCKADIYLSTADVVHGFNIYEKNVNLMAVPGGVVKTRVHFDKPGIYKVTCHEYCGVGHQNMQAEIIVYPIN